MYLHIKLQARIQELEGKLFQAANDITELRQHGETVVAGMKLKDQEISAQQQQIVELNKKLELLTKQRDQFANRFNRIRNCVAEQFCRTIENPAGSLRIAAAAPAA